MLALVPICTHNPSPEVSADMNEESRSRGGKARAANMTATERAAAAKAAATARWSAPKPLEVVSGSPDRPLRIGDLEIECYVLEGDKRVVTQGSMLVALGRSRRVNTKASEDQSLPPVLRANALRPFIDDELIQRAAPIRFTTPNGSRANGYDAQVLPDICEAWLKAREAGALTDSQLPIARAAEAIVRGLARVGIVALVDEATGHQEVRARDALAKILEAYVAEELQPYVRTFPVDYYKEIFRLRGIEYDPSSVKRPPYFGHLTNNIVYKRIAPGVFDEIKAQQAKDERKRRAKMFQQLTLDNGHPKLKEHLTSVTTVMKLSDDWPDFIEKLDRVHPIVDASLPPTLWDDEDDGRGL